MENQDRLSKRLYRGNDYLIQNPSLHQEDSIWKTSRIIPLANKFVSQLDQEEINLLDVGGGTGLILNLLSNHLEENSKLKVNRYALDLSPKMLEIQKKNNPNLRKALNEDIRQTSLADKEIDLTLMVDVLEHIPNPAAALKELKRISRYIIFKVPLEDCLILKIYNILTQGKQRERSRIKVGHINIYNFDRLRKELERNAGEIIAYLYTNVFKYFIDSQHHQGKRGPKKIYDYLGCGLYKISPRLTARIFNDFVIILVKCH